MGKTMKKPYKESAEPKKEERKEAKMPAFMRKKVEAKERAMPFKKGGRAKKGC
jgi:hypothetical protein